MDLVNSEKDLWRYRTIMKALWFYADPDTYNAIAFLTDPPCGEFSEDMSIADDWSSTGPYNRPMPGKRAREAIEVVSSSDELIDEALDLIRNLAKRDPAFSAMSSELHDKAKEVVLKLDGKLPEDGN